MFHRDRFEVEYHTLFKEYRMGGAVWSPLASGTLTGKHNNGICPGSRLAMEDNRVMFMLKEKWLSEEGRKQMKKISRLQVRKKEMRVMIMVIMWCVTRRIMWMWHTCVIEGANELLRELLLTQDGFFRELHKN